MSTHTQKLRLSLLGALYGVMIANPVMAEDIEIYKTSGATTPTTQANVLFVLDTSGSMGSSVWTRPAYDPNTTYPNCFNSNYVYRYTDNLNHADRYCGGGDWWHDISDLGKVRRSAVVCEDAASLDATGYYTGRVSQYRSNRWRSNIATNSLDDYVECENDNGVHGLNSGSSAKWASSSNGPWSSNQNDSVNWGSTGLSTTLYSGNYLNYLASTPTTYAGTRISVMQDVITNLVNSTSGVNIGLMRFDRYSDGGMVSAPVANIDDVTSKNYFLDQLDDMSASGGTPLSESFYEAAMYMQGKAVDYGRTSSPYASVSGSRTGNTYDSPIVDECQKNYVILLTDGEPTNDYLTSGRRSALNISSCSGNCLDEIAKSIATNDQAPSIDGEQFISTFTIGFAIDNDLLRDTANESYTATKVGKYYLAEDAASLAGTLNEIFENIFDTDTTFSSPAVSVNAFNRATHLNDLYFTLFKPSLGARWEGNFKKYKLDFFVDTNDVDGDNDRTERLPFIKDVTGAPAIDDKGFFSITSQSFWSDSVDGSDVTAGGVAGEYANVASRKVYTYTDSYNNTSGVFNPVSASAAKLTSTVNKVDKNNNAITEAMLGIVGEPDRLPNTPRRETLLDWAAGIDVLDQYGVSGTTTDLRQTIGDPLHSEPALVQYGGTLAAPELVAFVATNDGYLHAYKMDVNNTSVDIDDTVTELFSFIPQELLPNLNGLMEDASGDKTYGLDGNVVAWVEDNNDDGVISASDNDHVYLYIGQRRGGRDIYSIDVTDPAAPVLRWVIKGGYGAYQELGQTWSTINVEKIKDGANEKTVIVFGGGYDTNQDNVTVRTPDSVGRAVFIADAETGQLIWSAGPNGDLNLSEMKYSVPARIKPLDMSGDGLMDRMYMADMGGQIFRFDIDNNNNASLATSISGGRIADLAVDGSKTDARRFYYPPDVALIAERGKQPFLALSITSGYRAHPKDLKIRDRIYMLKDKDIYRKPSSYDTIYAADLYDATLNLVAGDGTTAQQDAAKAALDSSKGWYVNLDDEATGNWIGEKGLAETLILDGVLVATTFTPANSSTSSCKPQSGTGKVYFMDIADASPAYPSALDKRAERHIDLEKGGIPPSPNAVIPKGGETTLCVGTECMAADLSRGVRKTYWYEVEK